MIKTFEVIGSEYNMGYRIGQTFEKYLQGEISKYEEKISMPKVYSNVKELEKKLKLEFPKCLDEIYGRADGAKISRDSTLLMFFPEIYKKVDGCTTVIVKNKTGNVLFSHNEDDRNYNSDNIALIKYRYNDYWIVGYTMAEKLTGSSFAYNSYGLVFSSNYIYDEKINLNNISRYIIVRDVMNSKSLDEAIGKLRNNKVASAFSLNILDTNTNKVVNVEKDIDETYIKEVEHKYARSNHFIVKRNDLPEEPVSSSFRYKKTNELINNLDLESVIIDDLIKILNYETNDYYKSVFKDPKKYNDKSITIANFSVDNENKKIRIYDYLGDCIFDLEYNEFFSHLN